MLKPDGSILISGPTENLAYRMGRKLAGRRDTGNYHLRSIYDIKRSMRNLAQVGVIATLYAPIPLFEILVATER